MRSCLSVASELRTGGKPASLPKGTRIYAIGDIHGRLDLLETLLAEIKTDVAMYPILRSVYVFLGDYIDRGKWSRETIDRLIKHGEEHESVFLRGNHEQLAIACLNDRARIDQWLRLGGTETLASYGVVSDLSTNRKRIAETQFAFNNAISPAHFQFFRTLRNSFSCGDYFFAHAGAKPKVDLSRQSESDLLWIRGTFLNSDHDFGKIIVHGHTPVGEVEVRINRINVDTGAVATGRLTCLVLEDQAAWVIDTSANANNVH